MEIDGDITSYDKLTKVLEGIGCIFPNSGDWYYRGISEYDRPLLPSLYYNNLKESPKISEEKALEEFIKSANVKYTGSKNSKVWVNAFLSRHSGLKSRMMDWTIDITSALYFIAGSKNNSGFAALHVMPNFEDLHVDDNIYETSYFDFDKTAMLNPAFLFAHADLVGYKNRCYQSGKFLIQSYSDTGTCYYERNKNDMYKIKIPFHSIKEIYNEASKTFGNDPAIKIFLEDSHITPLCESINKKITL